MIRKLLIRNFRSIKELELELTEFNVLIGPNSSGKSNILKALNLIIGETYPSIRSFDEQDFFLQDKSNEIIIEVHFDEPIEVDSIKNEIWGFRLSYNGDICNYVTLNSKEEILCYPNSSREVKVSNLMREKVSLMYLPLDRQAYQQITPSQWKLYGKLLKYIASQIDDNTKRDFTFSIENAFKEKIFPIVRDIEESINLFVKEQTGLELVLRLSLLDSTNILRNLRPKIKYFDKFEVDVESEGAGIQSAVAIALARTYANITKLPLMIAIEEPELFLHPHGCRHFYRLLKELSQNGVQIIYTTHNRSFVRAEDYQSICIVRKNGIETEVKRANFETSNAIKLASKFNEELNEVFFADKVVLTEGYNDKIACSFCLEELGVNFDKLNISIVDCGGAEELEALALVLKEFHIETYALIDKDPGNPKTAEVYKNVIDILGQENVFLQDPNLEGLFNYNEGKFKKKKIKRFLLDYLEKHEVPQVYKDLQFKLTR